MTTPARKLKLAMILLLVGMVSALAFHAFLGRVEHLGYPWDSFLWLPVARFGDFYDVLRSASRKDPYAIWSIYFPFTYVAFYPAALIPWGWSLVLYFSCSLLAIGVWLFTVLNRSVKSRPLAAAGTAVLLGCSYAVWMCLDRGNIELGLAAMVCGFLFFAERRRPGWALACLMPAICLKLYPAALLGVYCRRGRIRYPLIAGAIFAVVTAAGLASFGHAWQDDLALWQLQLAKFRQQYLIQDHAMGGSANLWNPLKLVYIYGTIGWSVFRDQPLPPPAVLMSQTEALLRGYAAAMLLMAAAVTWYVTIVETDFRRKGLALLIFMTISAPGGADYKLVHAVTLVALAITWGTSRPKDLWIVILLALVGVPKKFWFFPYIRTDSGFVDCSIGVALNPAFLLGALLLLCWDGWRASTPRSRANRWRLAWFGGFRPGTAPRDNRRARRMAKVHSKVG